MSSIAYITDHQMIEYHRLNGNRIINFWKPSTMKKISDFNLGDYLFFLAKGTEKGEKREKGIPGYQPDHNEFVYPCSSGERHRFSTERGI